MTIASTTAELVEDVDMRLLATSRDLCSDMSFASAGQPMEWAKFSMDGVTGLLLLASTRSRRPEVRRVRVLRVGDAVSTIVTAGSEVLRGDGWESRFLRIVTLRMRSVFHSRSGICSTTGDSLSSSAPAIVSSPL